MEPVIDCYVDATGRRERLDLVVPVSREDEGVAYQHAGINRRGSTSVSREGVAR